MQQSTTPTAQIESTLVESSLVLKRSDAMQIGGALVLGITMLFAVGFMDVAHSAAHDTRHAIAFPCH